MVCFLLGAPAAFSIEEEVAPEWNQQEQVNAADSSGQGVIAEADLEPGPQEGGHYGSCEAPEFDAFIVGLWGPDEPYEEPDFADVSEWPDFINQHLPAMQSFDEGDCDGLIGDMGAVAAGSGAPFPTTRKLCKAFCRATVPRKLRPGCISFCNM